ncbi:MAG: hypothetical protein K8F30_09340, partial [Taibaiella sp.]|nr:hypothetical protein [Taibaiella sp.]
VVRLHNLGLISDWHYRTLFKQISRLGYRTKEPSDQRPEFSKLAELLLSELRAEGVGIGGISAALGLKDQDIADLLFDIAVFGFSGGALHGNKSSGRSSHLKLAVDNVKKS